ncbi:hypothetical protein [Nannocystis pusilla]|uniref:hypothetical protein n=1 Tax=Nannocystis pusilla TaxID=889268 RepID=UPI003BF3AD9A
MTAMIENRSRHLVPESAIGSILACLVAPACFFNPVGSTPTSTDTSSNSQVTATSGSGEPITSSTTTSVTTSATGDAGSGEAACEAPEAGEPGSLIRVIKFSGPGLQVLHGATIDPQGFIYVVGEYHGELQLDGTPMAESDSQVPFVYKFCPNGQLEWAQHGESSSIPLQKFSPESYRFAIAADAGAAYVTGRLLGEVTFAGVNLTLTPSSNASAFAARFDADGGGAAGLVMSPFASSGLDIGVDGDELFVVGMCNAPHTPDVTGILLAKLTTAVDGHDETCIPGGQGISPHKSLARSLALRPGEPTFVIAGNIIKPAVNLEGLGPCAMVIDDTRDGFMAAVSRNPEDWALPETLWAWCTPLVSESINDIVLDAAVSDQSIVATQATGTASQALSGCGSFSPSSPPSTETFSLVTIDPSVGTCTHAEWFDGSWGSRYLFSVEPAPPGEVFVTGQLSGVLKFRDLDLAATNRTFFGARLPLPPSQEISWYLKATHKHEDNEPDTRNSGGTHVTASDKVVAFVGYAMGDVELHVGDTQGVEVGSNYEQIGAPSEGYDAFLVLVRP